MDYRRMDLKLRDKSLVTSTLESVRMASLGRAILWCWERRVCKWWWTSHCALELPLPTTAGLSTLTKSEIQTHTCRLHVSCGLEPRRAFFLHILFLFIRLISLGVNNIVSTLRMRTLNEKQKYFWVEHARPPPLLCISPSYSFCQFMEGELY